MEAAAKINHAETKQISKMNQKVFASGVVKGADTA